MFFVQSLNSHTALCAILNITHCSLYNHNHHTRLFVQSQSSHTALCTITIITHGSSCNHNHHTRLFVQSQSSHTALCAITIITQMLFVQSLNVQCIFAASKLVSPVLAAVPSCMICLQHFLFISFEN